MLRKSSFGGEIVYLDSSLYLLNAFFCFGEWHSFVFFSSSCGLSERPFVFAVVCHCLEVLSKMISIVVSWGFFFGFSMRVENNGGIDIPCHLFADDTSNFCGANLDHFRLLCCSFLSFEALLGSKINLAKLELVPVGNVNYVEGLARILGCRVNSLPMKYLGLPLGEWFKPKSI
jgi:hypothetical protein